MRKLAIMMALASTTLATPAVAQTGGWQDTGFYAGIEAGPMIVQDTDFNYREPGLEVDGGVVIDHDVGIDVDLVGGYDMGRFRVELESAYKRARLGEVQYADSIGIAPDEVNGRVTVLSAMANGLIDFDNGPWRGYLGAGAGLARVKYRAFFNDTGVGFADRDNALAWQLIAGFGRAITPTTELGLKYRYFKTRRFEFGTDDITAPIPFSMDGKFTSHSLLASLIFNFRAPPPPPPAPPAPPPPPPPPATQTCPDGSVILATDACPVPPPPPPPPPPAPERG